MLRKEEEGSSSPATRGTPGDKALVHYGLGETERALELLEEAIENRDWKVRLLKAEPLFDALRSEPRFGRLLARAGFTE